MNEAAEDFPDIYPGTVKPVPDCVALTRAARLICVGDVVAVRRRRQVCYRVHGNAEPFEELDAEVQVRQVLKGRFAGPMLHVVFLRAGSPTALDGLEAGEHALLLLRREGRDMRFVDLVNGKLPIAAHAAPYQGTSPVERVLDVLTRAAASRLEDVAARAKLILDQVDAGMRRRARRRGSAAQ